MREPMYSVRVNDYSLPGFCSGDRFYYGTEPSIMALLRKGYQKRCDVPQAAEDYFAGRGPGAASLFGEAPCPLITPVEVIGASSDERNDVHFTFYNIYRWTTDIFIKHLSTQMVYIVDSDNRLKRCIKATVSNASYIGPSGHTEPFTEEDWMCWGLPGLIEIHGTVMHNTLFYEDTAFQNLRAVRKDIRRPHKPYLRNFFLEIYGDG